MQGKKKKRLTDKQRKLIKYYFEGYTKKEAALKAGYKASYAGFIGWQTLRRLEARGALEDKFDALGLSDEDLVMKIVEGLEAKRPDGSADFAARHRYLETALKLRGVLVDRKNVEHRLAGTLFDVIAKANMEEEQGPGGRIRNISGRN